MAFNHANSGQNPVTTNENIDRRAMSKISQTRIMCLKDFSNIESHLKELGYAIKELCAQNEELKSKISKLGETNQNLINKKITAEEIIACFDNKELLEQFIRKIAAFTVPANKDKDYANNTGSNNLQNTYQKIYKEFRLDTLSDKHPPYLEKARQDAQIKLKAILDQGNREVRLLSGLLNNFSDASQQPSDISATEELAQLVRATGQYASDNNNPKMMEWLVTIAPLLSEVSIDVFIPHAGDAWNDQTMNMAGTEMLQDHSTYQPQTVCKCLIPGIRIDGVLKYPADVIKFT